MEGTCHGLKDLVGYLSGGLVLGQSIRVVERVVYSKTSVQFSSVLVVFLLFGLHGRRGAMQFIQPQGNCHRGKATEL